MTTRRTTPTRRTSTPPRTLRIGISTLDEMGAEVLAVAKAIERGEHPAPQERLDFPDMATLLRTLTPERWRLLLHLSEHGPRSIQATAKDLGRQYKNVHTDVQRLLEIGLLEKSEQGVRVPYQSIVTELKMKTPPRPAPKARLPEAAYRRARGQP